MTDKVADPRITDIAKAGAIRLGLFLPQYAKTANGATNPLGAGLVADALLGALAQRLGITLEIVEQPSPHAAIETLNAGGCDVTILGFDETRKERVDFTSPVILFDFAYLVPAGSPIKDNADIDRPGRRIAVPKGHASWMTLKRMITQAEIIGTDVPDDAFALIRDGQVDVFALPREQLIDYAAMLPGSRVLPEGFGVNLVCFAVAKGRSQLRGFISDFVDEAKASGLVKRILDDAELTSRGFDVAPAT